VIEIVEPIRRTFAALGASLEEGAFWSYLVASSLKRWVDWCDGVGTKLIDDAINIDA
jgi:hypothetical protein